MPSCTLTQLSSSEYKLDPVGDFCLNSYGNFMIFIGNSCEITIFELMNNCCSIELMPYRNKPLLVSQEKPISDKFKNIDLVKLYKKANVQEAQEMAMDIIYTADCAVELIKGRVLQADIITKNNTNICCVLTNYGYCEFFKKDVIIGDWKPMDTNLSHVLFTEVFPSKIFPSEIQTYCELKNFANKVTITGFAISLHDCAIIIYLGTAGGYVVALTFNEKFRKFEPFCNLKTSLNRICYLVTCNNLILVGCDQGKVLLVKVNFDSLSLEEVHYLWRTSDSMACRKAIISYSKELGSYLVAFCKASHILAYRLDKRGAIESSSTLYVSGIKITGIEPLSENEFIITTVTGTVKYIKMVCPTKDQLYCEEKFIDHDFDSSNYQIIGLASSASKYLWSFLLYRNKDCAYRSKYSSTAAFVNVCKFSNQDYFEILANSNFKSMDMVQDLVLLVNLNIFNGMEIEKYMDYLKLENIKFPDEVDFIFLKKLQIKIIVTRKLAIYQHIKYKKLKSQTKNELKILEPVLQILHILGRLRYLKQQTLEKIKLSTFQELSIGCMQNQFNILMCDIRKIHSGDEENTLRDLAGNLLEFFNKEFQRNKFDMNSLVLPTEYCMMCNQVVRNFRQCEQEHEIKRCSISCTQLSLFKTKYCPHCYALARSDDGANLQELYADDDCITCIYCRFLFKQDEFNIGIK